MFLEEKLLQIARSADLENEEDVQDSIIKMVNTCFENINQSVRNDQTLPAYQAQTFRVDRTWNKVATILEEEKRGFIKKDGFALFIRHQQENKNEFEGILI
jgi:hypothetical protein